MRFKLVVALGAVALIAAACGGDDDDGDVEADGCTWVIGTLGALSGDNDSLGAPIAEGVEFAIDRANETGDVPCDLGFQAEDSEGNPDQAPALAQKLIENQKLVAVVGPYFSEETVATGNIFTQAGVAFSGTGTSETIDEQNFGTWFRAVASDNIQAEVTAAYIGSLGVSKVTVIHDGRDSSEALAEGVLDDLSGVEAQGPLVINPEESDYSVVVAEVNQVGPEVVYYVGYTPQAGLLARQVDKAGVEAQFISDHGSKDVTFGELAGRSAIGAQVMCPCTDPTVQEAASDFVDGMRDAYGEDAPGTFAADMYDVTNVIIEALSELNGDESIQEVRAHVVDFLDNADGIQGVAKSYAWADNGEFRGGPEDIWLYEWDEAEGNFVSLGPAADVIE